MWPSPLPGKKESIQNWLGGSGGEKTQGAGDEGRGTQYSVVVHRGAKFTSKFSWFYLSKCYTKWDTSQASGMRLKFMPGQLLLSLLVSIRMARMGRKKPSDGFCRDRATYKDSSELFPLHLLSSSVSCLNTQKTHVANAPTQYAVTEPGDSSPLQNDSYFEIHISSSLYPCFFLFSPCTCMWCKEAWLPIRDEKSGGRTILEASRYSGSPNITDSLHWKCWSSPCCRLKAKTVVSYLEISPETRSHQSRLMEWTRWAAVLPRQVWLPRSGLWPLRVLWFLCPWWVIICRKGTQVMLLGEAISSSTLAITHSFMRSRESPRITDYQGRKKCNNLVTCSWGNWGSEKKRASLKGPATWRETPDQNVSLTLWPLEF